MTSMTELRENYLDLIEAASWLRIHPASLRRLVKAGTVPAQLYAGKYLIERGTLQMFKANYDPKPGRKRMPRML